ncbi:MAG: hypothetical protein IT428_30850 [Planctomycetaceae bacterium]|nr:hypothetical protein [Planctomycetaceae bacterium]
MNSSTETSAIRQVLDARPVVVYKLGGSLLDLPDLGERLGRIIESRPETLPLVIVGGGPTADLVRSWDRMHRLEEETAHWLALRAMQLNERLVVALLPETTTVEGRLQARDAWHSRRIPVLSTFEFLKSEECGLPTLSDNYLSTGSMSSHRLPHRWDVTSDSIAAWIAMRWPARELILLKSTNEPANWREGSTDFVDPMFLRMADDRLNVTAFNLRDS